MQRIRSTLLLLALAGFVVGVVAQQTPSTNTPSGDAASIPQDRASQPAGHSHVLILEALQLTLLIQMIRRAAGSSQDVFSAMLHDLASERVSGRGLGLRIAGRLRLLIRLLAGLRNRGISRRQRLRCG